METEIREFEEKMPVKVEEMTVVIKGKDETRTIVRAACDGGFASVAVDLLDILGWVTKNKPELIFTQGYYSGTILKPQERRVVGMATTDSVLPSEVKLKDSEIITFGKKNKK